MHFVTKYRISQGGGNLVARLLPLVGIILVLSLPSTLSLSTLFSQTLFTEHAKELGNQVPTAPFYFLKVFLSFLFQASLRSKPINHPQPTTSYEIFEEGKEVKIELPPGSENVHHEVELGVIISRRGRDISEQDALSFVAGFTVFFSFLSRRISLEKKIIINHENEKDIVWQLMLQRGTFKTKPKKQDFLGLLRKVSFLLS